MSVMVIVIVVIIADNKWNEFKSEIRLKPSTETKNVVLVEVVVCWFK